MENPAFFLHLSLVNFTWSFFFQYVVHMFVSVKWQFGDPFGREEIVRKICMYHVPFAVPSSMKHKSFPARLLGPSGRYVYSILGKNGFMNQYRPTITNYNQVQPTITNLQLVGINPCLNPTSVATSRQPRHLAANAVGALYLFTEWSRSHQKNARLLFCILTDMNLICIIHYNTL